MFPSSQNHRTDALQIREMWWMARIETHDGLPLVNLIGTYRSPKCANLRSDRLNDLVAPPAVDCKIALVRRVNDGVCDGRA
jgi:hypothetical protein